MTKAKEIKMAKNLYGHQVRQWCGSCQHKEIENDGTRVCQLMNIKVSQRMVCPRWQMSDGLKNAGLQNGGVVRLRGTLEVIIK